MEDRQFAVWLGENRPDQAAGFVVEDSFYAVLELEGAEAENNLRTATEAIRDTLNNSLINTPQDLSDICQELVKKHHLSSVSACHVSLDRIFTYAHRASVLLIRQDQVFQASSENHTLSGEFHREDKYLILTKALTSAPSSQSYQEINKKLPPKEFVNQLKKNLPQGQSGALVVIQTPAPKTEPTAKIEEEAEAPPPLTPPAVAEPPTMVNPLSFLRNRYVKLGILALLLLAVMIKSASFVSSAIQTQKEKRFNESLTELTREYEDLSRKLQNNPTAAVKNLNELQNKISDLGNKNPNLEPTLNPLKNKINTLSKTYGSAEGVKEKLFYDLSLIDKKAAGDKFGMTENYISVLDNKNKKAYLISIENKNHEDVDYPKINRADLVTEYDDQLFLYAKGSGIYQAVNGEFTRVVTHGKNWGPIADIKVFNSNIYLLDQGKDEIYKFTPVPDGYGSEISYFQAGQSLDLSSAKSMAIDFSVYILGSGLWKYTAGARAGFSPSPELNFADMAAVYKTETNNYLYLLDPPSSRIVALNENGRLIKSIFNPKLKEAAFFGVYKDEKIIFMHQNKLYELDNF